MNLAAGVPALLAGDEEMAKLDSDDTCAAHMDTPSRAPGTADRQLPHSLSRSPASSSPPSRNRAPSRLEELDVLDCVGRTDVCWDNAPIESFG